MNKTLHSDSVQFQSTYTIFVAFSAFLLTWNKYIIKSPKHRLYMVHNIIVPAYECVRVRFIGAGIYTLLMGRLSS